MTDFAAIRPALPQEAEALAHLWHRGWQDGHAGLLPEALTRHRTLDSFRARMRDHLGDTRVAGPVGTPLGFSMRKGDELYQFYVDGRARGSGLAARLITDFEARMREEGVGTVWLACAIGNHRAARFYEKAGWTNVGVMTSMLDTPDGIVPLEVWRFEKHLVS